MGTVRPITVVLGSLDVDLPVLSAGALPPITITLGIAIDLPVLSAGALPPITIGLGVVINLPVISAGALPPIQILLTQTVFGNCSASAIATGKCTTPGGLIEERKPRVSKLEIWNVAAISLAIGEFTSVTEDSLKRARFDARWKSFKRKFLHAHKFKSAVTAISLAAVTNFDDERKGGWAHAYAFPCDYLRALTINDDETFASSGRFEVLADPQMNRKLLLTNEPAPVVLKYIYDVDNLGLLDPSVAEALGLSFGLLFAKKMVDSVAHIKEMKIEQRKALKDALATDGFEGSPKQFFPSGLLDAMSGDFEGDF